MIPISINLRISFNNNPESLYLLENIMVKPTIEADADYRNDCWRGFKDLLKRLRNIAQLDKFFCLCDMKMPEKMDRVIALAGGEIIQQATTKEDSLLKPCLLQYFSN